ncbi:MAG: HAMP domain-containing histidine kinase [Caldisericaceae bacterium]|nr:HAMP domain-containing histidine kinase [Caldisericaceae bacterium]
MAANDLFNEFESQILNKIKLNVKDYDELFKKGLELIKTVPKSQELFLMILDEYEDRLSELPPTDLQLENLEKLDENLKEKIKALILFGTQAVLLNENAQMQKQLQTLNQKYKDLLSIVTHEFKNALTSIYGYNRIIKKRIEHQKYDNLIPMIENIDRLTKNLFSMVETLLNMSLIEEGKLTLNKQIFDFIEDVLTPLKQEFEDVLSERDQKIIVKNKEKIIFFGDSHLFQIVFRNLILNAIQYGERKTNIEIEFFNNDGELEIHFQNYGMGIPEEQIPHIFEKFSRFSKLQGRHNVGLGLFTVKQIIEMHQGKIEVQSKVGEWIKFIIRLPNIYAKQETKNG